MNDTFLSELDFKHLQYALAVASCGSITKAAGVLYVAPPNLSRAIGELEGTLGFTLFIRTKKGMVPTPEGRRFLAAADQLLADFKDVITQCRGRQETSFSFACVPSSLFTNVILEASAKLPDCHISSKEYSSSEEFFQCIVKEQVDAGFIIFGKSMKGHLLSYIEERGLSYHFLAESPLYLIFSDEHPICELLPNQLPESPEAENGSFAFPFPDLSRFRLITNTTYFDPLGIRLEQLPYPLPQAASVQRGGGRAANLDMLDAMKDCILLTCRFHSRILKRNHLRALVYRPKTPVYEYGYVTRAGKSFSPGLKMVLKCVLDGLAAEFQLPL